MKNQEVKEYLGELKEGRKHTPMNLQFFAEKTEPDGDGDDAGDDDQDDQDDDPNGDDAGDDDGADDEPKFTQADMDAAVKERLSRERRKWQRQQNKANKPNVKSKKAGEGDQNDDADPELNTKLAEAEKRAEAAETRALCLELGVSKKAVADVVVLAQARTSDGLDIEDAIEEVLEDYPQFASITSDSDDDEGVGKQGKKKAKFVRGTNGTDKPAKKTDQQAYLEAKYGKNPYFKKKI